MRPSSPANGGVPARLTWRAIPDPASAPSFRGGAGRPLPRPRPAARPSASATPEVGAGGGGAGGAGCREGAGVGTPRIPEGVVLLPPGDPWPRRPVVRRRKLHFPGGAAAPLSHRLSGRLCEAARRGQALGLTWRLAQGVLARVYAFIHPSNHPFIHSFIQHLLSASSVPGEDARMKRHPPPPEGAPLKPTVTKTPREALRGGAGLQGWRGDCRPDGAGPRSWGRQEWLPDRGAS